MFGRCERVGSPVKGVAAVVNGAARLWGIVYCAQVLPFGSAHLGASDGGTSWVIGEQSDYDRIDFLYQKATELV